MKDTRPNTTVSAYVNRFRNAALVVVGIMEEELLGRFVSGLRNEIKYDVIQLNMETLEDAISHALPTEHAVLGTHGCQSQ